MLVKNVSNMCTAKIYYINHLSCKNCKSVDSTYSAGQLTD